MESNKELITHLAQQDLDHEHGELDEIMAEMLAGFVESVRATAVEQGVDVDSFGDDDPIQDACERQLAQYLWLHSCKLAS